MVVSKVLIIGATGYIGKYVARASVKMGHPTFALVRTTSPSDPTKAELLRSFQEAGITLLVGDLSDHGSLVAALKKVDVVISTVGLAQTLDQTKIVDAAKEAGTIKRFLPSEFGNDVDRMEPDVPPIIAAVFGEKVEVRRAIEKSGIPYTYVISGGFAGYYVAPVLQNYNLQTPPRNGKLLVVGDGNMNVIFIDEVDIGTFTVKAIDDPRAENKILHIRPKENIASSNEVIAIWEKEIGHTFEKEFLDTDGVRKSIDEIPFPNNLELALKYLVFVNGGLTDFPLNPSKDAEATELYPEVKYTTLEEYLTCLAQS